MSSSRASSAGVRARGGAEARAGQDESRDGARAEAVSSLRSERRSIDFADFGPSGFLIALCTPLPPFDPKIRLRKDLGPDFVQNLCGLTGRVPDETRGSARTLSRRLAPSIREGSPPPFDPKISLLNDLGPDFGSVLIALTAVGTITELC